MLPPGIVTVPVTNSTSAKSSLALVAITLLGIVACSVLFVEPPQADEETLPVTGDYYISPNGSDDNAGDTPEAPFLSWSKALSGLQKGETLVVMAGDYSDASDTDVATGLPDIDCGSSDGSCLGGCQHGTEAEPIRVVAQVARTAFLRPSDEWTAESLRINNCDHWVVENLVVGGPVEPPSEVDEEFIVRLEDSSNITLRGLVVHRDNHETRGALLAVVDSPNLLVEDSGFYNFRNKAIVIVGSDGAGLRRVHVSGRRDGEDGDCPGRGETAIQISRSSDVTFDNAVVEGACRGFNIEPLDGLPTHNVAIYGSLVEALDEGIDCRATCGECEGSDVIVEQECCDNLSCHGLRVVNTAIQRADEGIELQAPVDAVLENLTLFHNQDRGVGIFEELDDSNDPVELVPASRSAIIRQSLIIGSDTGVEAESLPTTEIVDSTLYENALALNPEDLPASNVSYLDPEHGGCVAYPSQTWLDIDILDGGGIVGANIRTRTEGGDEGDDPEPLWTSDGFPCGVTVPGVNDRPGSDCASIHDRFGIGTEACPLP